MIEAFTTLRSAGFSATQAHAIVKAASLAAPVEPTHLHDLEARLIAWAANLAIGLGALLVISVLLLAPRIGLA